MVVGGGIGGIILLIIALIFGINPSDLPDQPRRRRAPTRARSQPGGTEDGSAFAECKTGADANKNDTCRVIATVNSVQRLLGAGAAQYKREYTPAKTILYNGSTQSACGTASNQVGPFYCPLDKQVYIDAELLRDPQRASSAPSGGPLAQEYVVAHEYGHHIQDHPRAARRGPAGPAGRAAAAACASS